jgi:hypothetical protein
MYLRKFLPAATSIALLLGKNAGICNVLKRKSVTLQESDKKFSEETYTRSRNISIPSF